MPTKRAVLEELSRDELAAAVDQFDLAAADRRSKDALVDAVASSKKARLGEILGGLSRDRVRREPASRRSPRSEGARSRGREGPQSR